MVDRDPPSPLSDVPKQCRVAIIGGGVVGCSVAYHLTKLGWQDVWLFEQQQIAGGTTWHAAGLVGQLRTSNSLTKINKYSVELYQALHEETGVATGWNEVGSLIVGTSPARMTQLRRTAAMAAVFGVEADLVSPDVAGEKWPLMRTDDLLGAVWLPRDGKVVPERVTRALARGATIGGAHIVEGIRVLNILRQDQRVTGIRTSLGDVQAEWVILCGGMWSRQLGQAIGVDIPLFPVEHHYIVSEPIQGVDANRPVGRDPNEMIYFRSEDDGSIMLGAFQKESIPWNVDTVPDDFCYQLLPPDWEKYQQPLAAGKHRLPVLEQAQFPKFVNGPESFTPDNSFLMGPPAGLDGLFVLTGFNSVGIASAGGAGKYAAEWLDAGEPTLDLWSVDLRRFSSHQNQTEYLRNRVTEVLGLHYQMAWPNRELETSRQVRATPLYQQLVEQNASFGVSMCWERANWFAPPGDSPSTAYSFQKQNWAPYVAAEVQACRERVALFDQSTFSKFRISGKDALSVLRYLCANRVDVPIGTIVYTGMLNRKGGFESDLTLVRQGEDSFYLISSTNQVVRDPDWIRRHAPMGTRFQLDDVTTELGVVSIMGPHARHVLQELTPDDLSNSQFPFGTAQRIRVLDEPVEALRVTYVGELGWELHGRADRLPQIYMSLLRVGKAWGIQPAGHYAIQALRLEKGYRAWGHDLSPEDTPLEAGLSFAVDWDHDFLGKDRLLDQQHEGVFRRLVSLTLPKVSDPGLTLWGSEPILCGGEIVGYTTSGSYSPTLQRPIGMGYVRHPQRNRLTWDFLTSQPFEVVCDGVKYTAEIHRRAPYDPQRLKILC